MLDWSVSSITSRNLSGPSNSPGGHPLIHRTSNDTFTRLIEAMPEIAEAVNAFTSIDVQRDAFNALIAAYGLPPIPEVTTAPADLTVVPTPTSTPVSVDEPATARTAERSNRTRKQPAKRTYARAKDLNLRPPGKTSLHDFAKEKQPKAYHEKNVVVVFYLSEILEVNDIDVSRVLAGYHACSWKAPSNPVNSLQVTASAKGWLDTSDMTSIKLTHNGENAVKYDLPSSKGKTSA